MEQAKDLLKNEVESEYKATAEYLFGEVAELIRNNFVATYEKQGCTLIMRIPSGKTFTITVQDA